ncbi:MAG: hypothetical protein HN951_07290 [Flavobacteriales bacterium]|nr:hypothetical protein [Flavobacteriales bacterium]
MKRTWLFISILLCGLTFDATAAMSRTCDGNPITWHVNRTRLEINTNSFSNERWQNAVKKAVRVVNTNPSPFWIDTVVRGGDVGEDNEQNEIYATNIDAAGRAWTGYYCYWLYDWEYGIEEVDIVIDSSPHAAGTPITWTTSDNKLQSRHYGSLDKLYVAQAESVLVHELGHLMGLMHENRYYTSMGDAANFVLAGGGRVRPYFGENSSSGARALYGAQGSPFRDLSVSHWKRTGANGEYSQHSRTSIKKFDGGRWVDLTYYAGSPDSSVPEVRLEVDRGDRIRFEYTLENNGKQTETNVRGGVYISTNDWISTSDRLIGTNTWPSIAAQGLPYTFGFSIDIPNDLVRQRVYYVGYLIDDNNTVPEKTGYNNAAYIPIWIK